MSSFRLIEILSYSCLFEKGRSRETHCFGRRPHAYFHGAPARLSRSNWTFMPGEGETKRIYIIFLYLWFTCFSLRMVKYLPKVTKMYLKTTTTTIYLFLKVFYKVRVKITIMSIIITIDYNTKRYNHS